MEADNKSKYHARCKNMYSYLQCKPDQFFGFTKSILRMGLRCCLVLHSSPGTPQGFDEGEGLPACCAATMERIRALLSDLVPPVNAPINRQIQILLSTRSFTDQQLPNPLTTTQQITMTGSGDVSFLFLVASGVGCFAHDLLP